MNEDVEAVLAATGLTAVLPVLGLAIGAGFAIGRATGTGRVAFGAAAFAAVGVDDRTVCLTIGAAVAGVGGFANFAVVAAGASTFATAAAFGLGSDGGPDEVAEGSFAAASFFSLFLARGFLAGFSVPSSGVLGFLGFFWV